MFYMENISLYSVLLLVHLFGIILGAGGAFVSDGIFFTALKDRIISGDELRILKAGSHFIWFGIILLVISGTGLFLQDIERLSTSAKFISKMTVVLVIVANGVIFHLVHIPFIHGHLGKPLATKRKPAKAFLIPFVLASGVVSMVSWTATIVLGSLRSIPISYGGFLAVYSGAIAVGKKREGIILIPSRNHSHLECQISPKTLLSLSEFFWGMVASAHIKFR
jgi:uncharacterized membrane protein